MRHEQTEIKKLLDDLYLQGWTIRLGKHWILTPPDPTKRIVTISVSPRCPHVLDNALHDLRKSGWEARK